jgi:hypothetical protein
MSTVTAANSIQHYAANPSPRIEQSRLIAEQQAVAQRALQASMQNLPMVDPRLTAPPPTTLAPVQLNGTARTTTPPLHAPASQANESSSAHGSPRQYGATSQPQTSQAQSIPSISSLVHATDSVSVMSDNKSNSSRAGSGSPKVDMNAGDQDKDKERPRDIPHEKLHIGGEDQRAIRVLDRKFVF